MDDSQFNRIVISAGPHKGRVLSVHPALGMVNLACPPKEPLRIGLDAVPEDEAFEIVTYVRHEWTDREGQRCVAWAPQGWTVEQILADAKQ